MALDFTFFFLKGLSCPAGRRMFQKTTLLYSHFNVLHRSFAFFFLHPIKVYSAVTQIFAIPLFLMEVSVVKNIYPLSKKEGEG